MPPQTGKQETDMTRGIDVVMFFLGSVMLTALSFSPVAHAQQTDNVAREALQLHRPDNHATQKESISGGACAIQTVAIRHFARRYPPVH
jgi:hypothetical protein